MSHLCADFASSGPPKMSCVCVNRITSQATALRNPKRANCLTVFLRLSCPKAPVSVLVFADGARSTGHGQLVF